MFNVNNIACSYSLRANCGSGLSLSPGSVVDDDVVIVTMLGL